MRARFGFWPIFGRQSRIFLGAIQTVNLLALRLQCSNPLLPKPDFRIFHEPEGPFPTQEVGTRRGSITLKNVTNSIVSDNHCRSGRRCRWALPEHRWAVPSRIHAALRSREFPPRATGPEPIHFSHSSGTGT